MHEVVWMYVRVHTHAPTFMYQSVNKSQVNQAVYLSITTLSTQ